MGECAENGGVPGVHMPAAERFSAELLAAVGDVVCADCIGRYECTGEAAAWSCGSFSASVCFALLVLGEKRERLAKRCRLCGCLPTCMVYPFLRSSAVLRPNRLHKRK